MPDQSQQLVAENKGPMLLGENASSLDPVAQSGLVDKQDQEQQPSGDLCLQGFAQANQGAHGLDGQDKNANAALDMQNQLKMGALEENKDGAQVAMGAMESANIVADGKDGKQVQNVYNQVMVSSDSVKTPG